jgi:hypothetical protein
LNQFYQTYFGLLQDKKEEGTCFSILQHDDDEVHPDGEASFTFGEPILHFLGAVAKENSISFNLPTEENLIVRAEKMLSLLNKLGVYTSDTSSETLADTA